jgi:hypothetical protein
VAGDVRGGAPGTVNTDALRNYYGTPFTDAIASRVAPRTVTGRSTVGMLIAKVDGDAKVLKVISGGPAT